MAKPSSITKPSLSLKGVYKAYRGEGREPKIDWVINLTLGPETRIIPTPPRPGGVANAAIVS
ncbi:MAG: hypothetical protein LEGION0398_MBIBDBAK_01412 [Legionellaceae bacterium]